MRFATVCTLAFAICGTASRDKVADVSKGTTEDLEHRFRQDTNFEDDLSTTSPRSRVRRLKVILALGSAMTSADAFAPGSFQKVSNIAVAPILTDNSLDGTHDMLRPVTANRATPQVFSHDIKLYANRQGEEAQAQVAYKPEEHPTPADLEVFLEQPNALDATVFSTLNKKKDCRPLVKLLGKSLNPAVGAWVWTDPPNFNVLEEYTMQAEGKVAAFLDLEPEETAALWSYTHTDADIINEIARGADKVDWEDEHYEPRLKDTSVQCTLTKKDMLPWLKFLNAGLNKMPIAAPGRLYRAVGFDAEGTPGSLAPITGFSSFSDDFFVAKRFVEEKRHSFIQPTIFVIDKHSSARQMKHMGGKSKVHEMVFRVGTKFVFEEDEKVAKKVEREVEKLWRENLEVGERQALSGVQMIKGPLNSYAILKDAVPNFKVVVVKEVPSVEE